MKLGFLKGLSTGNLGFSKAASGGGAADPIGDALRADAVAYWKMDEASGARVDATGRGNTLLPTNNPLGVAGKVGNAVRLTTASSQDLSIASNADVDLGNKDFSIAFWVKMNSKDAYQSLVDKIDSIEGLYEYDISWDNVVDRFTFLTYESDSLRNTSPSIGVWYFIVCMFDNAGKQKHISVNESLVSDAGGNGQIISNADNLYIGSEAGFVNADADIDEMGFWHRLLTSDERAYLYNSGNGRTLYP